MTERTTANVLFTDLVGSTEIRSRLGENAADLLRKQHDALVARAIEANQGTVVKNLGDGIMATFAGASDAVGAAVASVLWSRDGDMRCFVTTERRGRMPRRAVGVISGSWRLSEA